MPSQHQGHRGQPRRVFRGSGGPTDGRLPPKKTARRKVKYPHQAEVSEGDELAAGGCNGPMRGEDDGHAEGERENELAYDEDKLSEGAMQQLSLDEADGALEEDEAHREIAHLRKRIHNVQSALQTSQGLSNPEKWRTNCLFPARNVAREWRSILAYHFANGGASESTEGGNRDADSDDDRRDLLHSTAREVFGLIQMSLQTGPLVGSNPGYFKRCGGEVASVAFQFLSEIRDLAAVGVDESCKDEVADEAGGRCSDGRKTRPGDASAEILEGDLQKEADANCYRSTSDSDSDDDEQSESESSCNSSLESEGVVQETDGQEAGLPKQAQTIHNLQSTFLFTEKQSQRFCQWLRNAEKAAEQNKPPSKSAQKLQSQKSKKQRNKELKKERKLKKKTRGGG
ncbi:hypothetical protein ACHAXT_011869 [Thalassiosira profunda]